MNPVYFLGWVFFPVHLRDLFSLARVQSGARSAEGAGHPARRIMLLLHFEQALQIAPAALDNALNAPVPSIGGLPVQQFK